MTKTAEGHLISCVSPKRSLPASRQEVVVSTFEAII
jgi:hypothetical protein